MKELFIILLSVTIGAFGQIILKYGALKTKNYGIIFLQYINLPILIGFLLYAISAFLWSVSNR